MIRRNEHINIKLSFSEGEWLTEMEDGDVFVSRWIRTVLRVLGEAADIVFRFSIRSAAIEISHPGLEVTRFFSVSAVGSSQDISLVDDGTSAMKLALQFKSDWRMFRIKIKSLSHLTVLTRLGF